MTVIREKVLVTVRDGGCSVVELHRRSKIFLEFLVTLQSNLCAIPLPERTEKRQKFRGKQHACERERENSPESSITPLGENDDDDGDDDYDYDDYGDGGAAKVRVSSKAFEGGYRLTLAKPLVKGKIPKNKQNFTWQYCRH
ncbi:hypothetical protein RUM44_009618 [Polyplax serrata]|uniref:Uncharacterized protein n=1 Tax=Polyplax serrata TaxID=468196 RepID=A0ABR1ATT2_POLSC